MEAYDAFPVSKFSFSLLPSGTNDESDSAGVFCSNKSNFNVTIYTDGSPYETSWELFDSKGSTLLMGGPYSYYKSLSTFNHLACLQDANGYNFTIFDSGDDGLKSPGYYDLMIGGEYIAKGAHKFDGSSSIIFNLMNGILLPEPSSSLDMSTEVQDNQYSLSNCSTVFTYSGLNVTQDRVSTSLFDVSKQAYVYQEQQNDPHDPKAPCLYDGVYMYTFQNPTNECVDDELKLLKDETNDFVLHSGSICSNDTFTFMAKYVLGKVETTLQRACMNDFHLVVPSNVTSAVLWELSGSNGVILRGDKLGPLSSRLNSHRVCMDPGTYIFTTWADKSAKYSLSYGKTAVTLDLDQITPIGTAMESVDISDLTFSSVGDVVGNYTSNIENDVWVIEGSGLGIGAKMEPLGNSDSFQYLYTKFSGDFAFSIKVNTEGSTSGGIMFRDSLDPDSKHYSLFTGKGGLQNLYRRTCTGCETLGLTATSSSTEHVCDDSNPQVCGCDSLNQTDYQGTISTTTNNTECLQWDAIENPIFYKNYPNASLEENSNYCRNPDGWDRGAWCFTSSDGSSWEECNVPICEGSLPTAKRSIWLRVVKEKDTFSSFHKDESGEWLQYGSPINIRFSNPEFHVGVAATSNNNETLEASNITISAEREQREFKFTLWDEQKVLPDGEIFEEFGKAIAVDGNTMVVSDEDSVYVFIKVDGLEWKQQDKLEASEGSKFTSALALDGDTLAVAALPSDEELRDDASESVPASESFPTSAPSTIGNCADKDIKDRFVLIYTRTDGMWTLKEELTDNTHTGGIGSSIALEGSRIVVGAKGDKKDCSGGGSVYVYTRDDDGKWEQSATLIPGVGVDTLKNGFGYAVALTGDTIVVGAHNFIAEPTSSPTYSPTVDYWTRMLSSETAYPTLSPTLDGGSIFPPTGDNENVPPTPADVIEGYGAAYVFTLNGDEWEENAKLQPNHREQYDNFGSAVALSSDGTLVVGAHGGSVFGVGSGVVYVYTKEDGGNWTEHAKLLHSYAGPGDEFAYSVAVNEDTIVVGSPKYDVERGSVFVFRRDKDNIWTEEDFLEQNIGGTPEFGFAVSLDGTDHVYIGAPFANNENGAGSGAVYEIFTPLSASSLQTQSTNSPASSPVNTTSIPSNNKDSCNISLLDTLNTMADGYSGTPQYEYVDPGDSGFTYSVSFFYNDEGILRGEFRQGGSWTSLLGTFIGEDSIIGNQVFFSDGDSNGCLKPRQASIVFACGFGEEKEDDSNILALERSAKLRWSEKIVIVVTEPEVCVYEMTVTESDLIDGYTFVGKGCCSNSEETLIQSTLFSPNTIYEVNDVGDCAKACREKHSSNDHFVGINFLSRPTWTHCNCLMDESSIGAITYTDTEDCSDELCYSYNDPTISLIESGCTEVEFGFNIRSDQFPEETTWALSNIDTAEVILRGFAEEKYTEYQYNNTLCLEIAPYEFIIYDSFGDGLYGKEILCFDQPFCDKLTIISLTSSMYIDADENSGGQYNVTVGGIVIMEGGEFKEKNISETFSLPLRFTEMPSSSPSTSMLPSHQPSMSLMPSTSSSPTLSFSPSNVPSVSMAPTSCFDLDINVTTYLYSNGFWSLSLVSNMNGTRDELIIDNSIVKLRVNGLLYSAAIFYSDYGVMITENATGILCDCGLGMIQCDDCQDKVCLIEQGDGGFSNQVSNCENGGGIAAVIYSNVPGSVTPQYFSGATTPDISAVYISQENGHYLLNNEIGTTVDLVNMESASTNEDTFTRNVEESLCLTRGEYHFTYREYYCYDDCYYNITIGGEMVIQGEMQPEEETVIPFSIPFVASASPSVSPSWAFFPSISPSITTQPTQVPSSLPSISPSSSLFPTKTPSIMPSIDCSDDVRTEIIIVSDGYPSETSWAISRIIRSNAQVVFEGRPQDPNTYHAHELCLQEGEYKFVINDSAGDGLFPNGSYRIVIDGTMIAYSDSGAFSKDVVSFSIPYIGTAVPTKAPITDSPTLAPTTISPTGSISPTEFIPLLDGYTFRGKGCCENAWGNTYSHETIYESIATIEGCVDACEAYSSDKSFVGINYSESYTNCKCMMDESNNGAITGAGQLIHDVDVVISWCTNELCYSYDDYVGDITSVPTTYPPSTMAPSEDTTKQPPTSSSLNPLSSSPSSPSSTSPAVVAVELRTKRVRHHSLPDPVQEEENVVDE